jgi:hypothetical protein
MKTKKKPPTVRNLKAAYGLAALPVADPLLDLPRANDDVRNLARSNNRATICVSADALRINLLEPADSTRTLDRMLSRIKMGRPRRRCARC